MKILYFITVIYEGRGGHFHSLNHISKAIGSKLSVSIVTIGSSRSSVLEENPHFLKHINFKGFPSLTMMRELKIILSSFKPDVLHFFDVSSRNIIQAFLPRNKYKYVLNHCGGPNPNEYPKIENLVLFSQENKEWFESQSKFDNSQIYLIPNRAKPIIISDNILIKKDLTHFNFVRISRFSTLHKKSIIDSIFLINELHKKKNKVKLYIIGSIEDSDVYHDILPLTYNNPKIIILTDKSFTNEASKMLYLADAVIATGRGVMEASSLGLPVLNIVCNSDFPVQLTEKNFERFFKYNFSARNKANSADLETNISLINKLIADNNYYEKYRQFSFRIFRTHFDVSESFQKYYQVYESALLKKLTFSPLSDLKLRIQSFYRIFRSNYFIL